MSKPVSVSPEEVVARAVAAEGPDALRDITPVVLAFGATTGADFADPMTLLTPAAAYTPVAHPLYSALASLAGARKMGARTFSFPTGRGSEPDGLTMLLNATPAGMVRMHCHTHEMPGLSFRYNDYPGGKLSAIYYTSPAFPADWLANEAFNEALNRHETAHPTGPLSRFVVTLDRVAGQVYVRLVTSGITYDPSAKPTDFPDYVDISSPSCVDLSLFAPGTRYDPLLMRPSDAVSMAEWLSAAGYIVTDAGTPGVLAAMRDLVLRSAIAAPSPGAPAMAELVVGADLEVPAAGRPARGFSVAHATLDAGSALAAVEAVEALSVEYPTDGIRFAVDPRVADVGRMANADPVDNPLLRPYQQQAVATQLATELGMLNALAPGLGKGQPVDAKVLTPSGFRRIGDVSVGDSVIGSNGKATAVTGVFPRGVLPVFEVAFSDGATLTVDGDHLWQVTSRTGEVSVTSTTDLAAALADPQASFTIPLVAPVEFAPSKDLFVPGSTMGVLLVAGIHKEVPPEYFLASVNERIGLIQGIADATRRLAPTGHVLLPLRSEALAGQVRAVIESLGGLATLVAFEDAAEPDWVCALEAVFPASVPPFRYSSLYYTPASADMLRRAVTKVSPAGQAEVVCIQVEAPDHLYVAERCIVTHNTVVTLTGMATKAAGLIDAGSAYHGLVAVPAAIRMQWAHETAKWFPEAKVVCVRTAKDATRLDEVIASAGTSTPVVVIASYQMLAGVADLIGPARDAGHDSVRAHLDDLLLSLPEDAPAPDPDLAATFARISWTDIVCDEAALVLRNPGSKRFQALWEMRGGSKVALALTGTPVDKSMDDLGRLLAWVRNDSDLFHGKRLSERFSVLDGDSLADYGRAIGPLMFRRDRSEIADELPSITTEVVLLEGRKEETALANAARSELGRIYADLMAKAVDAEALHPSDPRYTEAREALAAARGAMLGGVTLARMAASDPAAVDGSDSAGALLLKSKGLVAAACKLPGTKRTQIVDLVCDLTARGEQVLIFTDFSTVAQNLVADFEARGEAVGSIVGGQSDKVRDAAASGYQAGSLKVLVCTSAAREGMNLQATTTLIHYDLPWSPSMVVQRMARANRIGAKAKTLQVLIPVMAGTVEERVSSLLASRAATAMSAVDGVRGVDARSTEMGLALGGLVDSANDGELSAGESSLLEMARTVLS